jgi:hypothetical protein
MRFDKLDNMTRGWFVGDFTPTGLKTTDVEVGIKSYKAGDKEKPHHHRIATEVTTIISGVVRFNGLEFTCGDIITIEPFESVAFESVTDSVTVVVKTPGAKNDKYED